MGKNKPRLSIFNPSDANSIILERGLARVSAQGASIARVKSKEGEGRFPGRKTVRDEPFRCEDGEFYEKTSTVNNYLFFIDPIVFFHFLYVCIKYNKFVKPYLNIWMFELLINLFFTIF